MKKKLLSALLCLALALTLLPTAALAAPTRLKSVDLVIDLPKAGDPNEMETEVTIKSMKSGNIDLLANGEKRVQYGALGLVAGVVLAYLGAWLAM